jgi:hypothetical protein
VYPAHPVPEIPACHCGTSGLESEMSLRLSGTANSFAPPSEVADDRHR